MFSMRRTTPLTDEDRARAATEAARQVSDTLEANRPNTSRNPVKP